MVEVAMEWVRVEAGKAQVEEEEAAAAKAVEETERVGVPRGAEEEAVEVV